MHMTELYGQVIRCNLARPTRIFADGIHNQPGSLLHPWLRRDDAIVWANEAEDLQEADANKIEE